MNPTGLRLQVLPGAFSVCKLPPGDTLPAWAQAGSFFSLTVTDEELSVVCETERVPDDVVAEHAWRGLKVEGPLNFQLVGVLAALTGPLAEESIPVFVVSTYNTDYVLIKQTRLDEAVEVLERAGSSITR